jgi:hypothetical protein
VIVIDFADRFSRQRIDMSAEALGGNEWQSLGADYSVFIRQC